MAEVVQDYKVKKIALPVTGGGVDLMSGAILIPGVTAETNDGVLINNTATSNADAVGILLQLHDFSESGDATVAGLVPWYTIDGANSRTQITARDVALLDTATLLRVAYDNVDLMTAVSSSGTTVTVTSLEDNIDTAFLYVVAGLGIGQLAFIATSTAGSCVTSTAFATALDTTSTLIKILPLFHQPVKWDIATATDITKLGTDAAAGSAQVNILKTFMRRNGLVEPLDPLGHGALTGLNALAALEFFVHLTVSDTAFHPIN